MTAESRPILFLGRFHPALVHLPIGFFALLVALELVALVPRYRSVLAARGVVVGLTLAAAVLSVVLGLMLRSGGGYDPVTVDWHQYLGIGFALSMIVVAVTARLQNRGWYYGTLIASAALILVTGHLGGTLSHGPGYLTAFAPAWMRSTEPSAAAEVRPKPTDVGSAGLFADVVRPILTINCVGCHGPDRISGGLRLDSYDAVANGGGEGPGSPPGSPILTRILLPANDSHHMPPSDKPQPTDDQIALVRLWVQAGASPTGTVASAHPTPDLLAAAARTTGLPDGAAPPAAKPEDGPRPFDEIAAEAKLVETETGATLARVSADGPWLAVNAAVARSFGDDQLKRLLPFALNVQSLDLAGTGVTDAGLAPVSKMRHLVHLRLDRSGVTDAGLKFVENLPALDYLNLYGTRTTDAALASLKTLPSLRHLYIWNTGIDPDSAARFAADKPNPRQTADWRKQIDQLRDKIEAQRVEVVGGARVSRAAKPPEASAQ